MSKKKKNNNKAADDKAAKVADDVEPTSSDAVQADEQHDDEAEAPSHSAPAAHHAPDRKEYWRIFGALAALTLVEVIIADFGETIGKKALVTALVGLALTKAALVANFFMHLKHETVTMKWTVLIPVAFPTAYAFVLIAEGMYRSMWGGS